MNGSYRQCRELDISLGCLKTIQDYIGANNIFKARYDMTLYNPKKFLHSPHIDGDEIPNYVSAILYMNDSDGDTFYTMKSVCVFLIWIMIKSTLSRRA